jgi:HAD superfamily hydrolase (TIGR01509 family)
MRDELKVPLDADAISAAVVAKLDQAYREHLPLIDGAVESVRALAERWPLALASSANREVIDLVLELSGLADSFQATVSSEEVAKGKPSPDVYLEAARRIEISSQRCVAVEDSANGIRAAHDAGMKVVAVPNPELAPDPQALQLAEVSIETIAELSPAVVERLGG